MALKLFPIPFPISAPPPNSDSPQTHHHRPPTEIRFSRWNNANAEKFNNRRRAQQEIEDDIRRHRRFNSAANIIDTFDLPNAAPTSDGFKSVGSPSSPSTPSIPGKKSKYSKPKKNNPNPLHPAFRRTLKITKLPQAEVPQVAFDRNANIRISDDGLSYVVNDAPFEFKYSYTETPKVKPLKLREAPFTPFGPTTMARPWTGRAPLPPSKKKLKEFDSFQLPPANKKGVKPVQAPGPFRPGTGPRYVKTREEIIGEPLTKAEVKDLIDGCLKAKRQLNMGRDGLTHNMLDNIHAHWKRRRVCKIRCKGVCTVDMENVCQQLEEKTGGKIIFRQGGTLYLFRGRNYNYRTRPYFPLMLWKPITPVYPRLIQRAPEGLTLEEASEMRKKGRKLIPICKLAKNGVYCNLVEEVREAFEECELVRINCQGINGSDYRKIGAKLRDLVPCVLISFEREHILMWRGRDWKFSFTKNDGEEDKGSAINVADLIEAPLEEIATLPENGVSENALNISSSLLNAEEQKEAVSAVEIYEQYADIDDSSITRNINEIAATTDDCGSSSDNGSEAVGNMGASESISNNTSYTSDTPTATITVGPDTTSANYRIMEKLQVVSEDSHDTSKPEKLNMPYMEGVLQLWKQALESGSAVVLTDADMDADTVYQRAVAFAQSAPTGPVFRIRPRKVVVQKSEKQENGDLEVQEVTTVVTTVSKRNESAGKSFKRQRKKDYSGEYLDVPPHGSLKVDELAKLLA